jgi:hypothetical protein
MSFSLRKIARMNHTLSNALLNDLLVELHRSLVQYAAESWLWSTEQAGELRGAVLSLAERQRQDAGMLVHFLMAREQIVDFGVYPAEFTRLHYVSLEYLYQRILESQRTLTEIFAAGAAQLHSTDPQAAELIMEIERSEREGLEKLTSVEVPGAGKTPVWMK